MKAFISLTAFLTILFFLDPTVLYANDSTASTWDKDKTWDNFTGFSWRNDVRPFVEVGYGYITPDRKNFEGDFQKTGSGDIRLGYSRVKAFRDYVVDLDEHFAFGNRISTDLGKKLDEPGHLTAEIIRFGFGNRLGYGYEFNNVRILPYSEMTFSLAKMTTERPQNLSPLDINILERYERAYRWSHGVSGGIRFELFESVSLLASYETSVVFPRIVFWPWLGGIIVQGITIGAVSHFAEDIVDNSSAMGPLMYAILRNGITYVVYLGVKEKMNWPFNSEIPLTHEGFKFGFSLTF